MRTFVNMLGRSSAFLFNPRNAPRFMPSIQVGFPRNSGLSQIMSNDKQFATQASSDGEEVRGVKLNPILAAIENAQRSTAEVPLDFVYELADNGNAQRFAGEICARYVNELCKISNLAAAVRFLQCLHDENVFVGPNAYNVLLAAAADKGDIEILSHVFKILLWSCQSVPSTLYLNFAKGFIKTDNHAEFLRIVRNIMELTLPRRTMVINRLIFAFAESGQFDKAFLIFEQMKVLKCDPDLITYNTVLDALGCLGQIDKMLHKFASMKEAGVSPDFISYNTLLKHLRKVGRLDLCSIYFKEMVESGIQPDLLTYTALIGSFGRAGNIEESLRLFSDMKMRKIHPSIYVYRSLINSLKKMGRVELAMTLMEEMNASLPNLAGPKDFKRKNR